MTDFKSWVESKTIWAILVALSPIISAKLGLDWNAILADVVTIGGGAFAIYFRIKATKLLTNK